MQSASVKGDSRYVHRRFVRIRRDAVETSMTHFSRSAPTFKFRAKKDPRTTHRARCAGRRSGRNLTVARSKHRSRRGEPRGLCRSVVQWNAPPQLQVRSRSICPRELESRPSARSRSNANALRRLVTFWFRGTETSGRLAAEPRRSKSRKKPHVPWRQFVNVWHARAGNRAGARSRAVRNGPLFASNRALVFSRLSLAGCLAVTSRDGVPRAHHDDECVALRRRVGQRPTAARAERRRGSTRRHRR
jgi:hypothetical protein